MDRDTRDFILEQNDKLNRNIEKLREGVDSKLSILQRDFNKINVRLGEGAEKFKSLDGKIDTEADNNSGTHKLIFWVLGGIISSVGTIIFFLIKGVS